MGIQLNPSDGLRNVSAYPTNPTTEAAAREQIQGIIDQIVSQTNSELVNLTNLASLSTNGWFKDKKTGLIIQWGKLSASFNANQVWDTSVVLPIQFPNAHYATIANLYPQSSWYGVYVNGVNPASLSAFQLCMTNGAIAQPLTAHYISIGR